MSVGSVSGSSSAVTNDLYQLLADLSKQRSEKSQSSQEPLASKSVSDLDTDGDGSISQSEFTTAIENNAPSDVTKSQADQFAKDLFSKIDTNGDGSISSGEWGTYQSNAASGAYGRHGHHHHHGAGGASSLTGTDSSATATSDTSNSSNSLLSSIDSNSDGTISTTEFQTWLNKIQSTLTSLSTSYNSSTVSALA